MNIVIVGCGKIGRELSKRLSEENHNVTVVDKDEKIVEKLVSAYDVNGIHGSGTRCDILSEAQVESADLLIATTRSDENNILACMIGGKMGAKYTIARVRNPEYSKQIGFMRDELGITMMINPDFAGALEINRIIQFPSAMNIETFSHGRIDMAEIILREDSSLCNMKISDISTKFKNNILVCAVCRGDEVYIPNGDFVVKKNDRIHITGSHKYLGKITRQLSNKPVHSIKDIMIIGGSRIAVYLANLLTSLGKNVVIVEKNREKCKLLCELTPDATIINGDANDHDILIEDGICRVDSVVTLTDADETNFLISMYAESLGVPKNITKINNTNLEKLLDKLGKDSHINISDITCNSIIQYVRAKMSVNSAYMKTLYKLVDGRIEAAEFIAGDYVTFLNKPLASINTKNNVLIAAVCRKNKIIFPGGSDAIMKDDLVIVVSKDCKIYNLNDILA